MCFISISPLVVLSMQQLQMAQQANDPQMAQQPMAVMQDAQQVTEYKDQMDKFGRTLELLYDHNIDEQVHPFKIMMKLMGLIVMVIAVEFFFSGITPYVKAMLN